MDADRYKKGDNKPKKRSVNSDDSPSSLQPHLFDSGKDTLKPKPKLTSSASKHSLGSKQLASVKSLIPFNKKFINHQDTIKSDSVLSSDLSKNDGISGVWEKQKSLKRARQIEEAKTKEAKKAAKILKKQQKKTKGNSAKTEIAISVSIPKVSKPKLPRKLPGYNPIYKKYYFGAAALLMLPVCLIVLASVFGGNGGKGETKKPEVQGKTVATKPDFSTLKPTTRDNQATETKYDSTKKVASYNDVLKDVPITVSQQPLPAKFAKDPTSEVANLAKEINANDKISTSDATAYAGVSIKGPQTVVFTKNDLLVFIIADKKIDQLAWADYIEKMQ